MTSAWLSAALGGLLLGVASSLLLLTHGRIAGISNIVGGLLDDDDRAWRAAFVVGLALAGIGVAIVQPSAIGDAVRPPVVVAIAGVLVGFGASLGSGCTSGHGVCGLARWSVRSLVAVAVFMTTGAITAMIAGAVS